jgi:hypothetical protein
MSSLGQGGGFAKGGSSTWRPRRISRTPALVSPGNNHRPDPNSVRARCLDERPQRSKYSGGTWRGACMIGNDPASSSRRPVKSYMRGPRWLGPQDRGCSLDGTSQGHRISRYHTNAPATEPGSELLPSRTGSNLCRPRSRERWVLSMLRTCVKILVGTAEGKPRGHRSPARGRQMTDTLFELG